MIEGPASSGTGKVIDLADAPALVVDSAVVAIGGNSQSRKPMAMIRQLIRAGRRDLELVTFLGSIDVDLLLAAGSVRLVRAGYVGFDLLGLAPHHTACPADLLRVETEASIVHGLQATTSHVPFLPARGVVATDVLAARPDVRLVTCPYTGEELVAWPAISVDVALLHVAVADVDGNALLTGAPVLDHLLSEAAAATVVSAERIVPRGQLPGPAGIRADRVTAVVHAPGGAHPTGCFPRYRIDLPFLATFADGTVDGGDDPHLELVRTETESDYLRRHVRPRWNDLEVPA